MSQVGETFFTSVGCMDGRSECAVARWGREKFGVKYADAITEAGLVGILSKPNVDKGLLNSLKQKILISVEKHHSKNVVVSGHQDCAGNPVEDARHKNDIVKAVAIVRALVNSIVPVVGVFVKRSQNNTSIWEVEDLFGATIDFK